MRLKFYTQTEFKKIFPKYSEPFFEELMDLEHILELPRWGGRVVYVLMSINREVAGFARIQRVPGLNGRDIQDLFIFSKFRGKGFSFPFLHGIYKKFGGNFYLSIDDRNMASIAATTSSGGKIITDKKIIKKFDKFWNSLYKNIKWAHYLVSSQYHEIK